MSLIVKMKPLLDMIAKHESRGDYNIVWGKIKKQHLPPKPLVEMTVQEVLDWQDSVDPYYMSEAAGRYQIMEDTLRPMVGVQAKADELFNELTQDRLAVALLKRRGLNRWLSGDISDERFANYLAMEWASLPVVTDVVRQVRGRTWTVHKGSSYYAGDGLNAAHADIGEVMEALRQCKGVPLTIEDAVPPPKPKRKWWQIWVDGLRSPS